MNYMRFTLKQAKNEKAQKVQIQHLQRFLLFPDFRTKGMVHTPVVIFYLITKVWGFYVESSGVDRNLLNLNLSLLN